MHTARVYTMWRNDTLVEGEKKMTVITVGRLLSEIYVSHGHLANDEQAQVSLT